MLLRSWDKYFRVINKLIFLSIVSFCAFSVQSTEGGDVSWGIRDVTSTLNLILVIFFFLTNVYITKLDRTRNLRLDWFKSIVFNGSFEAIASFTKDCENNITFFESKLVNTNCNLIGKKIILRELKKDLDNSKFKLRNNYAYLTKVYSEDLFNSFMEEIESVNDDILEYASSRVLGGTRAQFDFSGFKINMTKIVKKEKDAIV